LLTNSPQLQKVAASSLPKDCRLILQTKEEGVAPCCK